MSVLNQKKVEIINQSYINQKEALNLQAARKRKLLKRRLAVFFAIVAITTFFIVQAIQSQNEILEAKQAQLEQLKKQHAKNLKQQKILEDEIIKLQDDEYIGKYARQEYFLSGEGEIIFTIPDEKEDD